MQASFLLFVAGLVAVSAAPQAVPAAPADPKAMVAPLASQVRTLLTDGKKAIEAVEKEALAAKDRLLTDTQNAFGNMNKEDRANLPLTLKDRALQFTNQVRSEAAAFLEKSLLALSPLKADVRSSVLGVRDLANMVEKKYLTDDGQALVRSLLQASINAAKGN